jgi:hypothetical protein
MDDVMFATGSAVNSKNGGTDVQSPFGFTVVTSTPATGHESDADGLLAHGLLRSHQFRWEDIASISVHKYSSQHGDFYTPTLNIKNGQSYKLSALTERSYTKAEESVNRLNDAHTRSP